MQSDKKSKIEKKSYFSPALLAVGAILSALSILLGKYLAINVGETIRLSFENLPILLAGLFFGPWVACAVGVVADLLGCLLVGYAINPIITLGAALIGILSGICGKLLSKTSLLKITVSVISAHVLGSVVVKTIGLYVFYQMPFWATLGWRTVTYAIISILEIAILFAVLKSRTFTLQMKKIQSKN